MGVSPGTIKLPASSMLAYLRYARSCYDCLAGEFAVNIYERVADIQRLFFQALSATNIHSIDRSW